MFGDYNDEKMGVLVSEDRIEGQLWRLESQRPKDSAPIHRQPKIEEDVNVDWMRQVRCSGILGRHAQQANRVSQPSKVAAKKMRVWVYRGQFGRLRGCRNRVMRKGSGMRVAEYLAASRGPVDISDRATLSPS